MNEIVDQIAARVGITPELAEKAVGMMLGFLQREAADGPVAKMIEAIPGASDLVAKYNGEGASGGGIMALGQQLMSEGLGMGEITTLAKETIAIAEQHAGKEVVDEVVGSVPGLSQFV